MGLEDIDENQLLESEDSEEENQDTNASQNLKDGEVNIGNLTALSTPIKENNVSVFILIIIKFYIKFILIY